MRPFCRFLVKFELPLLLVAAPAFLFPVSTYGLAVALVLLLWASRWVAHGRIVPRTPLDAPLVLLLGMVAVSLLATFDPLFSLPKVTGVVWGVALFYGLVERSDTPKGLALNVGFCLSVALGITLVGTIGTQWGNKVPGFAAVTARLPQRILQLPGSPTDGFNPNGLAGALLLPFPLFLALAWPFGALRALPRPARWLVVSLGFGGAALVGATLLLTQSRAGYLGLLAGLGLLGLPLLRYRVAWGVVGLGVLGLGVAWWNLPPNVGARLPGEPGAWLAAAPQIVAGREEIWLRALYGIQDFPITGMGMGMFRKVVPLLYPYLGGAVGVDGDIGHAHNLLLSAGVDLGIPGLIAFLALWLGAAAMAWRVWHSPARSVYRLLSLGVASGLLAHFVWGIFDANVLGSKAGLPFWLSLAILVGTHRLVGAEGQLRVEPELSR